MLKYSEVKKKPKKLEEPEHIAFVAWFKKEFPSIAILHCPNGGARDKKRLTAIIRGKALKAMGVMPGVYDLFIPQWFLWIEMKPMKGGYLSKDQKIFKEIVEGLGYVTFKANGCQEAIDKLTEFLKGDIPCLHSKYWRFLYLEWFW